MINLEFLRQDGEIQTLLRFGDKQLEAMGYTEHSERHRMVVAERTRRILECAGCSDEEIRLGEVAAYLHDIGCAVNRHNHAQSGAIMAYVMLTSRGMSFSDATAVANAVANHDEHHGHPSTPVAAALIIADKSDVHRNRVRRDKLDAERRLINIGDIHDRVNYSVIDSRLDIDTSLKKIVFRFALDSAVSSAMDYFEIFLGRMKMCKEAAQVLGYTFNLEINKQILA